MVIIYAEVRSLGTQLTTIPILMKITLAIFVGINLAIWLVVLVMYQQ